MHYDAILIGSGQATGGLADAFVKAGERVALIEGDKLGGTCLNYGCRPTKALRASARVAHVARRAAEYGIQTGTITVDFAAVMARKDRIIGEMKASTNSFFEDTQGIDVYHAYGYFDGVTDDIYRVRAGDALLEAKRVYINTGTRPTVPPIDGIEDVAYLTNETVLSLDVLPRHLVIIGGSYVGLEFGQMFARFGSKVTIVESSAHIASKEDQDVSEAIEEFLRAEGIDILTGYRAERVASIENNDVTITVTDKATNQKKTLTASHLLMGTGRTPNTDNLHLQTVGIKLDDRGYIQVNDRLETDTPNVWALGDVNGRGAFTHTSYQDHEIVLANHEGGDRSVADRIMAYAMYTDPPLGRVGLNEEEARKSGKKVLKAVYPMAKVTRPRLDSETQGLIKLLVDADTEQFLGATVLGLHGDDVIQIISNFMHTGASYQVMKEALPIHPTVAEYLPTILGMLEPLN